MEAPIAKRIHTSREIHGVLLEDDYAWLKDKESPEVHAYLNAENDYKDAKTAHTKEFQEELYKEMLARIKEDDQSVPYQKGDYWYYTRTESGKAYAIHCRKKGSLDSEEIILIDENALAEGHEFFDLGDLEISPDERWMAYTVDIKGDEKYALYIKDLQDGTITKEAVEEISPEIEWCNDNRTLYYTILDDTTHRPYRLFRYVVGSGEIQEPFFEEPDDAYYLNLYKTKDEKYFFLYIGSNVTTEMYYFSADDPLAEPILFQGRNHGVEFGAEHHNGHIYILTNEKALNFKLMRTLVEKPEQEHWEEVIPHNPKVMIDTMDVFKEYLVIYLRREGLKTIHIRPLNGRESFDIPFEEAVYTVSHSTNIEFDSKVLRFRYGSLTIPASVYDYDLETGERTLLKRQPVLGGYDPELYGSERIFVTSWDGAKVPVSIVYRKDLRKEGPQALFLYAYGSYGVTIEPFFSSSRLSLIDRGVIFAFAHIRGGGSMGRQWYEDGKFLNKKNSFADFIACSELLIQKGYTSPEHLAVAGGSAGGMLMGAIVNYRPELFKVVEAHVPFVDVVNTMLDPTLPLTVPEYDEWGNPEQKAYFDYMHSYSPYDNVEAKEYPDMLITAGLNDPRVHYWEPAKWCAKLRLLKTDKNLLLLKTNMDAGHQGASGRYGHLKEVAFDYAFVLDRLGLLKDA